MKITHVSKNRQAEEKTKILAIATVSFIDFTFDKFDRTVYLCHVTIRHLIAKPHTYLLLTRLM